MNLVTVLFAFVLLGVCNCARNIPGDVPGAKKISDGSYACPLKKGTPGDGKETWLTVIHCFRADSQSLKCPWILEPTTHFLSVDEPAQVVEEPNEYWFNISTMASYYGNEICISWLELGLRRLKIYKKECRSECFQQKAGPLVYDYEVSAFGSYFENSYKFEKSSNSARFISSLTTVLMLLMTVALM